VNLLSVDYVDCLANCALRKGGTDGHADRRAELLALNAVFKAHGPPRAKYGHVDVRVGELLPHRAQLCVLGVHRHLFSEVSATPNGVESLLLSGDSEHIDDCADTVLYRASAAGAEGLGAGAGALRCALRANQESTTPVRIIRAVGEDDSAHVGAAADGRHRVQYRYDGLYIVNSHSDAIDAPFELLRCGGQLPLPSGAKRQKRALTTAPAETGFSLRAVFEKGNETSLLPAHALRALGPNGLSLSVPQALAMLRAAREKLVGELSEEDAYELTKQGILYQVRIRSAVELLHAGDDPQERGLHGTPTLAPWPARQRGKCLGSV